MKKSFFIITALLFAFSGFSQKDSLATTKDSTSVIKKQVLVNEKQPTKDTAKTDSVELAPICGTEGIFKDCNEILELHDRVDIVLHKRTGKPFTGTCETCYNTGYRLRKVNFTEGLEDSITVSYYDTRKPWVITSFKAGIEDGEWKYYYRETGNLAWENFYQNGKKIDTWKWYHLDGTMKKEIPYEEDFIQGSVKQWDEKEQLISEVNYEKSKYHGAYTIYYPDGQISLKDNYNEGIRDGNNVHYFKDGTTAYTTNYKEGDPEGNWQRFYENGSIREEANFKEGYKDGQFKKYYENGNIQYEGVFKKGILESEKKYDDRGSLMSEYTRKEEQTKRKWWQRKKRKKEDPKQWQWE